MLFLWDCHVVTENRSKQLYFSHDQFGLAKGVALEGDRKLPAADPGQIRARVLPVWWTDLRNCHAARGEGYMPCAARLWYASASAVHLGRAAKARVHAVLHASSAKAKC